MNVLADKLQSLPDGGGFLCKKIRVKEQDSSLVDFGLLTEEERKFL